MIGIFSLLFLDNCSRKFDQTLDFRWHPPSEQIFLFLLLILLNQISPTSVHKWFSNSKSIQMSAVIIRIQNFRQWIYILFWCVNFDYIEYFVSAIFS